MKEKVIEFFKKNGRFAILCLFILELALSMFVTPDKFDDAYFIEQVTGNSIFSFVRDRYDWWSSRVIIEFILCFVLKTSKYLWVILEAFMVALAGYSISRVFVKENKNENTIMLIFMILAYPLNVMASAGWAATTVNYMWPLATLLFSLIPIRKIWDDENIKWYEYILYTIALFFAGNAEISCAILVGSYILFTILYIVKNKKVNLYLIIQNIIILASLAFIVTCPGNHARNQTEIAENFKNIEMLSFFDKISLGFTSTIGLLIGRGNIIYTIFTMIIAVFVFANYKEKLYRVIAVIPFLSIMLMHYLAPITVNMFGFITSFGELLISESVFLSPATSNNLLYAVPLIFAFANFISIGLSLLLIFKNLNSNVAIVVFLAGLASRLIMGFSPTLFKSGERTMIFFEFSMIIISILIWQELIKKNEKNDLKVQKRTSAIIKCIGAVQYINVLLCILYTQK
jgi:hypothetical protein